MDPLRLTHPQLDALREITHIGCGAAASALSQLLGGRRVALEVTRSQVLERVGLTRAVAPRAGRLVGARLRLRGGAEGVMLLAWPEWDARDLAALLRPGSGGRLDDLGESALMEVANIVASAYLTAVGRVTDLMLLPSVPALAAGDRDEVTRMLLAEAGGERVLLIDTWLRIAAARPVDGHVVIVPTAESLGILLQAVGL